MYKGLYTHINSGAAFNGSAETQAWAIRAGAEPVDLHLLGGPGSAADEFVEDNLGITAGIGGFFNHNYLEIGRIGADGEFEAVKRIHAIGVDENFEMAPDGRLVGIVVDGEHTRFSDDPIQRNDPHDQKQNQLQHADEESMTKVIFEGTERQVMEMYGAMVKATIELNNQDPEFGLLGQGSPNSNSFNTEMKEKVQQMAEKLGFDIKSHDADGWDIGWDYELDTSQATLHSWASREELHDYIDTLEQKAAEQFNQLKQDGTAQDLETKIPRPDGITP